MKTRNLPRKNYAPPTESSSSINSSDERAYNSESTESEEKPNSQDRRFIVDSSLSSENSFKLYSDQTETTDEPFVIGSKAPISIGDSPYESDLDCAPGSISDSDYSDVVFLERRKITKK